MTLYAELMKASGKNYSTISTHSQVAIVTNSGLIGLKIIN
jgi:hypothetical protein